MTIYNQILYVTSFSATFSLLGLLTAGQLMPAIRWVWWCHVLLPRPLRLRLPPPVLPGLQLGPFCCWAQWGHARHQVQRSCVHCACWGSCWWYLAPRKWHNMCACCCARQGVA